MNRILVLATVVAILVISGCKSVNTPDKLTDKLGDSIITQQVISNQKAVADSNVNYSYYLPTDYDGKKQLPMIIFLDPHADGNKPLQEYSALADKYGYIFIASNNIRNGLSGDYTYRVFRTLMTEAQNRFVVDSKRIFSAGFSGGAKLAVIYANNIPEVIGVAACGGTVSLNGKPGFYYAGIIGNQDFNYLEMNQTFSVYERNGYDFTSVIFNGGHQWPPVESFEPALIGFNIYSIKTKKISKDNKWLEQVWQQMSDSITLAENNGDLIKENIYLKQTARWFYGLKDINEINKKSYAVEHNQAFIKRVNKRRKLIQNEVKLRTEFVRAFELKDTIWWSNEIHNFHKAVKNKDEDIAQVSQRLLNYLSMVGFMLSKADLDNNQIEKAFKKIRVYQMSDPENPDVYLMYARYYMMSGNNKLMIANFKKAQELGFSEYDVYIKDNSWKELLNNESIKQLI